MTDLYFMRHKNGEIITKDGRVVVGTLEAWTEFGENPPEGWTIVKVVSPRDCVTVYRLTPEGMRVAEEMHLRAIVEG